MMEISNKNYFLWINTHYNTWSYILKESKNIIKMAQCGIVVTPVRHNRYRVLWDHFFHGINTETGLSFWSWTIPSLVSLFEVELYQVWSRFLKLNDTDAESGLVFWKWTIPIPSLVHVATPCIWGVNSCGN